MMDALSTVSCWAIKIQTLQIGGLALYHIKNPPSKLPFSSRPITYPNRSQSYEDNLPWLAEARQSIEKHRKANIHFSTNLPTQNGKVHFKMKKHSFLFGSVIFPSAIHNDQYKIFETSRKLDEKGLNAHVFYNAMKWDNLEKSPTNVDRAINILDGLNYAIRGHCFVWGDDANVPTAQHKNADSMTAFMDRTSKRYAGKIHTWDVLNEFISRDQWERNWGYDSLVRQAARWYRLVQKNDPKARLYYNDNDLLANTGYYQSRVEWLKRFLGDIKKELAKTNDDSALDGVGFQAHQVWSLVDPVQLKKVMDAFASLELKLQVTEFDFKKRYANSMDIQVDFLRDFMTTLFAHPAAEGFMTWTMPRKRPCCESIFYSSKGELLPTGKQFIDLVYRKWWTDENRSMSRGKATIRGFKGVYDIVYSAQGKTETLADVRVDEDLKVELRDFGGKIEWVVGEKVSGIGVNSIEPLKEESDKPFRNLHDILGRTYALEELAH